MSAPITARVQAGTPSGGQFAPTAHAEAATTLAPPTPADALPSWGDDLEAAVADRIAVWVSEEFEFDGEETRGLAELVSEDGDEDALVAAYGERRSGWLIDTKVTASGESRMSSPGMMTGSLAGPAEYDARGVMTIHRGGKTLRSASFTFEDPPELGCVTDLCPTLTCPECGGDSDQDEGVPCSMCMSRKCPQCLEGEPDGEDGLCSGCAQGPGEDR